MFSPSTRILVIDDMATMRKLVAKSLKDLGYTSISEAADGAIGWNSISEAKPPFDLIISDWNMPNSSGLDLLRRVRADGRFKTTPFIMLTAEAEQHQVVEAVKSGVDNYIIKPFTTDTLRDKLEQTYKKVSK